MEVKLCGSNVGLFLIRDVSQEHVVQEDTQGPDCGRDSVVGLVQDPLRRGVCHGACGDKQNVYVITARVGGAWL